MSSLYWLLMHTVFVQQGIYFVYTTNGKNSLWLFALLVNFLGFVIRFKEVKAKLQQTKAIPVKEKW